MAASHEWAPVLWVPAEQGLPGGGQPFYSGGAEDQAHGSRGGQLGQAEIRPIMECAVLPTLTAELLENDRV